MKTIAFLGMLFTLLLFAPATTYANDVRLIIDDQEISNLPTPPMLVNAHTLVPARAVFEHMGGIVGWHEGHQQVSIFMGNDVIVLTIGSTTAQLNGQSLTMTAPPILVGGSTMIPLRFPAEAFGFYVSWDDDLRAAIIDTNGNGSNSDNSNNDSQGNWGDDRHNDEELDSSKEGYPGQGLPPASGLSRNISTAPITTVVHPPTSISNIATPSTVGTGAYVITASSAISQVSYFVLYDNRLVVDIHNAASLISGDIPVHASLPIAAVRAAQFSSSPMVTRIVFELTDAIDFSLSLSADRTLLTVAFTPNHITHVFLQSDLISDSIFIQGNILPDIRICTAGFPNYLEVNIDNARMLASGAFHNGIFTSRFITGHRADGTAYVRIFVGDSWPTFSVAHSNNTVVIMLHHSLTGIRYDSARRELHIARNTGFSLDISRVVHVDEYLRLRYTLELPHSAAMLGRGELGIIDGYINSVTLQQGANGNAVLVFDTARILTFTIHQTPESYIIRAHLPRDVRPFIVVIDPGHGGWDPGTHHNGIREMDLVLTISHKVMELVNANPFITGYMTRSDNTGVANMRRAEFANELGADLFISVHANAAEHPNRTVNPTVHGIETWYNSSETNSSMSNRELAAILQRNMVSATGAASRGLRNGPGLVVVRETYMPAALVEVGFLTNPQEAARLASASYQWQLALAIYNSIVEVFYASPALR